MSSLSVLCALTIMAGAAIMLASVIRIGQVLGILSLAVEPHRSWLARRVKLHRVLMSFFLVGYIVVAAACVARYNISKPVVAAVFFFGAVFVHIGITLQNRMSSAVLRTLQGLLPICACCRRVKVVGKDQDRDVSWEPVEQFIAHRTDVHFSHSICADCRRKARSKPSESPQQ